MRDEDYFEEARRAATQALCERDKCGAVIVLDGQIISRGYNAPPHDNIVEKKCHLDLRKSTKPKSDRTCCVHAEWRAITQALTKNVKLTGSTLYFARADAEGKLIKALGVPYCTVCSRLALDAGISFFSLITEEGVRTYDTKEFNNLSYEFHEKANRETESLPKKTDE